MSRRRQSESGFALLLIFVLAAGIAIAMLMQLPRYAFETARNREEMLIQRGEQYKRALALYFRKTNRLPAKIEDLENTNNIRFLRRRYIDPMTGKDEWRVIHAGPGGVLIDSLVQKAPGLGPDGKPTDAKTGTGSTGTQSSQLFGSSNPGNTTGTATPEEGGTVNSAVLRRPSDRVPMPGVPGQQGFDPNAVPDPNNPNAAQQNQFQQPNQPLYPGQPGYPQPGTPGYTGQPIYPGQPGYPVQRQNTQNQFNQQQPIYPGQPGYPQPGTAGYTGQPIYPGQPGYPQQNVNQAQQPGMNPMQAVPGVFNPQQANQQGMAQPGMPQFPGQPGQPGQPQGAFNSNQNNATQMINDLLRNPRQNQGNSAFNNSGLQGGIAGFASKFKGPSIKIYKERQKYQEWEFVYDIKDDPYLKKGTGSSGVAPGNNNPLGARQPGEQQQQQQQPPNPGFMGR